MAAEFQRHSYLEESAALSSFERDLFARLAQGRAAAGEVSQSLLTFSRLLTKHHKSRTVILIDEYNAPIMAAYTHGYYSEAVDFLKSWLTGALKGNDSLAFACLTGVQRISKESIFSDLNNLTVNTSMSVVFPDIGTREEVLWSMLYLAGYLTTNDVELPNNKRLPRTLRIPNREIAELYRTEIVERYGQLSGGPARLAALHRSVIQGNASQLEEELSSTLLRSASYCDLDRENSYHMLMLGLLMGIQGYEDPLSNREAGQGRFDILLTPCSEGKRPIIMEFKRAPRKQSSEKPLSSLALRALEQIDARAYATAAPSSRPAPLCYGIAFCGKNVAVACSEA